MAPSDSAADGGMPADVKAPTSEPSASAAAPSEGEDCTADTVVCADTGCRGLDALCGCGLKAVWIEESMLGNLVGRVVVNTKTVSLAARDPRPDTAAGLESAVSDKAWYDTDGVLRMLVGETESPASSSIEAVEESRSEEDAAMGEPPTLSGIDLLAASTPPKGSETPRVADIGSAPANSVAIVYRLLTLLITDANWTMAEDVNGELMSVLATDTEDLDKARIAESIAEGSVSSVIALVGDDTARAKVRVVFCDAELDVTDRATVDELG